MRCRNRSDNAISAAGKTVPAWFNILACPRIHAHLLADALPAWLCPRSAWFRRIHFLMLSHFLRLLYVHGRCRTLMQSIFSALPLHFDAQLGAFHYSDCRNYALLQIFDISRCLFHAGIICWLKPPANLISFLDILLTSPLLRFSSYYGYLDIYWL